MYAIVEIAGKQYKITQNEKLEVDSLKKDSGKVSFDKVLLYAKDDKNVEIGHPYINGALVEAEIIKTVRGDKVRVFKMKSKKRYTKTHGFRKTLSLIQIKDILLGAKKVAVAAVAAEEKPKAAVKKAPAAKTTKTKEKQMSLDM